MKKIIILSLILSIFGTSCASRKVSVDKVDSVVKIDSTSVTKQEVVTTQDNHVSVVTDTDELEIIPIDTTKSIEVDGKKYKNVKLRYKKTKKVLVDTTKIKTSENVLIEATVKKSAKIEMVKKDIDKQSNNWWWFLILLLALLAYYTYKRINKTLF